VYVLILFLLLGLLPAFVARQKGHSFMLWWLYGALLFIVALPHAALIRTRFSEATDTALQAGKPCPYCEELVPQEDEICPFCHLHLYDPVLDGPAIGQPMTHRHA
jgi:hypothetical protein